MSTKHMGENQVNDVITNLYKKKRSFLIYFKMIIWSHGKLN